MDLKNATPYEVRKMIRNGEITTPTSGMCAGYAQCNLAILPKDLAYDFNHSRPSEHEKRDEIVHKRFWQVGENVFIQQPITVARGTTVSIGSGTYINSNLTLVDDYKITIGKDCLIAPNVTISTTGPIGCIMNLLSSCCFACTAALIYKKQRNLNGAILGLLAGSAAMVATMLLWNYLITPLYMTGTTRSDVAAMLIPVFLPFNALKAGFNSALTLLLYKPLVTALRRTGLVAQRSNTDNNSKLGLYAFAGILLITCILILLVLQGKI